VRSISLLAGGRQFTAAMHQRSSACRARSNCRCMGRHGRRSACRAQCAKAENCLLRDYRAQASRDHCEFVTSTAAPHLACAPAKAVSHQNIRVKRDARDVDHKNTSQRCYGCRLPCWESSTGQRRSERVRRRPEPVQRLEF
jgi:hypothetical protein